VAVTQHNLENQSHAVTQTHCGAIVSTKYVLQRFTNGSSVPRDTMQATTCRPCHARSAPVRLATRSSFTAFKSATGAVDVSGQGGGAWVGGVVAAATPAASPRVASPGETTLASAWSLWCAEGGGGRKARREARMAGDNTDWMACSARTRPRQVAVRRAVGNLFHATSSVWACFRAARTCCRRTWAVVASAPRWTGMPVSRTICSMRPVLVVVAFWWQLGHSSKMSCDRWDLYRSGNACLPSVNRRTPAHGEEHNV